jgi:hypothetical protein
VPVVHGEPGYPWAKSDTVPAGTRKRVHFDVGPNPAEIGTSKPIGSGIVRCGFLADDQAPENHTGWVELPDNGIRVGPIDLPFELAMPLPCRVIVQPDSDVGSDRVVLCTLASPTIATRWQATRWEELPFNEPAQPTAIPQWVHSVSVYKQDAAVSFFDALGNLVCAVTGPVYDVPRPRRAVLLATTDPDGCSVLFSYQA